MTLAFGQKSFTALPVGVRRRYSDTVTQGAPRAAIPGFGVKPAEVCYTEPEALRSIVAGLIKRCSAAVDAVCTSRSPSRAGCVGKQLRGSKNFPI